MIRPFTLGIAAAAWAAALLLAGCSSKPPAYESPQTAQEQCDLFRGYLRTQAYVNVMESCTRHLGEAYCRQCLNQ